jgi:hypothetical protein
MINVDIIIPSIISYQKYPKFQKFQKFQIFQNFSLPSWMGNWFPVWYNLKNFKRMGLKIRFINYLNIKHKRFSSIVGFDSRIINNLILKYHSVRKTKKNEIIPLLNRLKKKVDYLVFFDNADSTGYFHNDVMPYVDHYFKKQLFKDFSLYAKPLYRKRLFTDFYARNYNLHKKNEDKPTYKLDSKHINKISLSWNFALKDYRSSNILSKFLYGFIRKNNLKYYKPSINRKIILAANYTVKNAYDLVYFQRNQLLKILKEQYKSNPMVSLGKIPKKNYLKTMRSSKAIISPFGWGEICYRDFETFISGAALIKPDMDHLDTWPNLYKKHKTYIPIPWKIEEWKDLIPEILTDENYLIEIAKNGQNAYKKVWSKQGNEAFCDHFIKMVTPK